MARLRTAPPARSHTGRRSTTSGPKWRRLAVPAAGIFLAAGIPGVASAASSDVPSAATLQAALLTATDLGQTYSTSTDSSTDSPTTYGGCQALQPLLNGSPTASQTEQGTELQAGENGPFINEGLLAETPAALAVDYARDSAALKTCKNLTITSDGTTLDFTLSPVDFTPGPSTAVRLDGTVNGVETDGYLAVSDLGDVEVQYFYLQVGSAAPEPGTSFFTKAVTKAQTTLNSPAASAGASPQA